MDINILQSGDASSCRNNWPLFFSHLRCILFLLLTCYLTTDLAAQVDGHYWTHQYGARGLLMNGAVIASPEGETALFYNPGAVGMDEELGFELSFITPTYSVLRKTNLLNNGNVIKDDGLNTAPGFLGARFKPFESDRFTAGITTFNRLKTNINLSDRIVNGVEGSSELLYRGDIDFSRRINEIWFGFSLAYNITDQLGVGLTQFSTWHSQSSDLDFKKEIVEIDEPTDITQSWRSQFAYSVSTQSAFVAKLGLAFRADQIRLGLTMTTGSYFPIRKRGSYLIEDHRINELSNERSTVSNRAGTKNVNRKSPFSIGLGLDVLADDLELALSGEYFRRIKKYNLLELSDDPYDGVSTSSDLTQVNLNEEAETVFNIAVALKKVRSEKTTLFVGFRTDIDQEAVISLDNFPNYLGSIGSVYHFSGGGLFTLGKNRLSLGMDIAYGRQGEGLQLVDLSSIDQSNIFQFSGDKTVTTSFFSTMIFCTYDFIAKGFK